MERIMEQPIEFRMKKAGVDDQLLAIEVYRTYTKGDGTVVKGFVDHLHCMNMHELIILKNFLQEYIQNNDWN